MVDSFSASAISQIYDKVNDANKKKMEKLPITKLANLAFKMMQKNEFVPEEADLDEKSRQLKDPKKEVMVVKKGEVIVIDKKDQDNYMKKGWKLAEGFYEASARSDAMKAMRKGKSVDPADVDNTATDDDVKAASKNILMQLRKAVNLRGTFAVEFGDKKKVKVSAKIAQAAATKYNSLKRPAEKEKFQAQIGKSYADLLKSIKESTVKESKFGIINKQLKGEK